MVTVVSAGVTNAAALAADLDPEALHRVMARFSDSYAGIVERHGGTVERRAAETAIGFFGLTAAHEDDALRALRAAVDLRETAAQWDDVQLGMGIDCGEVFVGSGRARRALRERPGAEPRRQAARVGGRRRGRAEQGGSPPGRAGRGRRARRAGRRRGRLAADRAAWRRAGGAQRGPRSSAATRSSTRCAPTSPRPAGARLPARDARRPGGHRQVAARARADRRGRGRRDRRGRPLPLLRRRHHLRPGRGDRPPARRAAADRRAARRRPAGRPARARRDRRLRGAGPGGGDLLGLPPPARGGRARAAARRGVEDVHWAEPTLLDLLDYVAAFSPRPADPARLPRAARAARGAPGVGGAAGGPLGARARHRWRRARAGARPGARRRRAAARIVQTAEGNPLFLEQLVAVGAEGHSAAAHDPRRAGGAHRPARAGGARGARCAPPSRGARSMPARCASCWPRTSAAMPSTSSRSCASS